VIAGYHLEGVRLGLGERSQVGRLSAHRMFPASSFSQLVLCRRHVSGGLRGGQMFPFALQIAMRLRMIVAI
jgi:hypothetical protein